MQLQGLRWESNSRPRESSATLWASLTLLASTIQYSVYVGQHETDDYTIRA